MVDLEDQANGARLSYQIVGEDEADLKAGRISVTSPIARALVAKSEGDIVDVVTPGGIKSYEIVAVKTLTAQAFGSGMIRPGLDWLARYSTATCPMRWTRVLPVRFARSASRASRACAIGAGGADLDQFVIMQGAIGFLGHGIGQAVVADLDNGFQGMGAAAQKAALVLGYFHDCECNG